jgi:hypothetical protein
MKVEVGAGVLVLMDFGQYDENRFLGQSSNVGWLSKAGARSNRA